MKPPVSMVLGRTIEVAALVGCSTSTNVMNVALSGVIAPLGTSWTSEDAAAAQQSRAGAPGFGREGSGWRWRGVFCQYSQLAVP